MTGFDVIGDVHGYADKLKGLLHELGFRRRDGAFTHPDRRALFVGDLIDRGPQQIETLEIVRSMVDAGSARMTMGNHECNAIAFATPDPRNRDEYMRPRRGPKGEKNRRQHQAFLQEVGEDSPLHMEWVKWFKTLPLWLKLDGLRIIHACWHDPSIAAVARLIPDNAHPTDEFWVAANTKDTEAYRAVDTILKGPEIELGKDRFFVDKEGHARSEARIRWWDSEARTLRDIAEIPPDSETPDHRPFPQLPDIPSGAAARYRYRHPEPVFYGHYWRTGHPTTEGLLTVCVDYSAGARKGPLVAYRWDGESVPQGNKFVAFGGQ